MDINISGPGSMEILGHLVPVLLLYCVPPLLAIAAGLLIFFLGRRHVRRKYGKK